MGTKVNYTAVGLFVIGLGFALAALAYWLLHNNDHKLYKRYAIYATDSVSGLNPNARVLYRGVEVGKVTSIRIDPERPHLIRIFVEIDAVVPIRADTVAKLYPVGITGLSMLNLSGGASADPLPEAETGRYPVIPYENSVFSKLEGGVNDALIRLTRMGEQLEKILSDENIRSASSSLQNIQHITEVLASNQESIAKTLQAVAAVSENIAALTADGRQLIGGSRELVEKLGESLHGLGNTLQEFGLAVDQVGKAGEATRELGTAGAEAVNRLSQQTLPNVSILINELQELGQSMNQLVNSLRDNPSQLLFGRQPVAPGPGESASSTRPDNSTRPNDPHAAMAGQTM